MRLDQAVQIVQLCARPRGASMAELCAVLERSPASIKRDLSALRDLGTQIVVERGFDRDYRYHVHDFGLFDAQALAVTAGVHPAVWGPHLKQWRAARGRS